MHRPGRCGVPELPDCVDDPEPDRHSGIVTILRELVGPSSAFHLCVDIVGVTGSIPVAPTILFN